MVHVRSTHAAERRRCLRYKYVVVLFKSPGEIKLPQMRGHTTTAAQMEGRVPSDLAASQIVAHGVDAATQTDLDSGIVAVHTEDHITTAVPECDAAQVDPVAEPSEAHHGDIRWQAAARIQSAWKRSVRAELERNWRETGKQLAKEMAEVVEQLDKLAAERGHKYTLNEDKGDDTAVSDAGGGKQEDQAVFLQPPEEVEWVTSHDVDHASASYFRSLVQYLQSDECLDDLADVLLGERDDQDDVWDLLPAEAKRIPDGAVDLEEYRLEHGALTGKAYGILQERLPSHHNPELAFPVVCVEAATGLFKCWHYLRSGTISFEKLADLTADMSLETLNEGVT